MHISDIVQDSEGYLSPYKVLSHLYQKCGHNGAKLKVHFRKSAKSRMPDCKSHDCMANNEHFHRLISYFHVPESAVGMVSFIEFMDT